jgi:phosphoglycerol transferase MdoB-like AlkP superfamily enzyme
MERTLGEYINDEQFFTYYMTVSGHHPYSFADSSMAKKNQALVEHLQMSEECKAYIACIIELDRALEHLITELDKAGKLENTVFCLSTDHYPYGLTDPQHQELLGHKYYYDGLESHKQALIVWNCAMETVKVDKPCCTVDVLPTLLNLFGFDYDSRLYSGRDILSDCEGIAMTSNQSLILADSVYNSRYGFTYEYYHRRGEEVTDGRYDRYIAEVKNRFAMASAILNYNFYSYLDQELIAKAQAWEQRPPVLPPQKVQSAE